ncbi:hypothetical protein GCM10020331_025310 [Ectobacillus funiculus]
MVGLLLVFRFAIVPTEEQATRLEQAFGCERKVYNEYIAGLYEYLEGIRFEGGFYSLSDSLLHNDYCSVRLFRYKQ